MGRAHEVRAASMAKTAAAKSKLNNKYGKLIYMAAKNGGSADPNANLDLRRIIDKAKKDQCSADVIKRALEKASGGSQENYFECRYEGFAQGGSMLIVDCLSDNENRTFSDVRTIFGKGGAKLGVSGCCSHSFEAKAVFSFKDMTEEEVMEALIMADVDADSETDEDGVVTVYAARADYSSVKNALLEAKPDLQLIVDETTMIPNDYVTLTADELPKFQRLLGLLEENDDVQNVYHNVDMPTSDDEE